METKDCIDFSLQIITTGIGFYFAYQGLKQASKAVNLFRIKQVDRYLENQEKSLFVIRKFVNAIDYVRNPLITSERLKDESESDFFWRIRVDKHRAVEQELKEFRDVLYSSDMYLAEDLRAIVKKLDEMWLDLSVGFRLYLLNLSHKNVNPEALSEAYARAFGVGSEPVLKEMRQTIESMMLNINKRVAKCLKESEVN